MTAQTPTAPAPKAVWARRHKLCRELPLLEHKLRVAGLYKTAMEVRKAVQTVGFELADMLTKAKVQP